MRAECSYDFGERGGDYEMLNSLKNDLSSFPYDCPLPCLGTVGYYQAYQCDIFPQ